MAQGIQVYQVRQYSLKIPKIGSNQFRWGLICLCHRLATADPNEILSRLGVGAFGMHGSGVNLPWAAGARR